MLTIRPSQIAALDSDLFERFVSQMVVHAREFFPEQCECLGEGLRDQVSTALRRALAYGFRRRSEACRFLNLWFRLGPEFPEWPEVASILSQTGGETNSEKLTRILMLCSEGPPERGSGAA